MTVPPTSELEYAIVEWREARKAFFAVPPIGMDPKTRFPQDVWVRLGHAEHRLMQLAQRLD